MTIMAGSVAAGRQTMALEQELRNSILYLGWRHRERLRQVWVLATAEQDSDTPSIRSHLLIFPKTVSPNRDQTFFPIYESIGVILIQTNTEAN